jgi:hypothetical protein
VQPVSLTLLYFSCRAAHVLKPNDYSWSILCREPHKLRDPRVSMRRSTGCLKLKEHNPRTSCVALWWLDAVAQGGPIAPPDGFGLESAGLSFFLGMSSLDFCFRISCAGRSVLVL